MVRLCGHNIQAKYSLTNEILLPPPLTLTITQHTSHTHHTLTITQHTSHPLTHLLNSISLEQICGTIEDTKKVKVIQDVMLINVRGVVNVRCMWW